ncbi:ribonuclease E/G [Commensalibacter oyaizuii]|uniref:Ribonuclease E/G n=1 Tax=Commensalibacter oyaizuii TaxID=3043873 RepID=A0ABT6Q2Y6_9PROT|nr:ribonuclease E/G [Commensalibacter sp. TBRC 16381]MDI2091472.1 ribonuclease E/G [Commensalibacter sp. TBRC 16381]
MIEIRTFSAPGVVRIAVVHHNQLLDFSLWYPGYSDELGDIHFGRVATCSSALGGAFITLCNNKSGFLPNNADSKSLHEGDGVIVRVTRSAQGGKGIRLDQRNLPDFEITQNTPHLLKPGPSPLETLAKRWPNANILLDDLHLIELISPYLKPRIQPSKHTLDPEIVQQIEALEESEVELPMGMHASIVPTPALVAIDMDGAVLSNDNQSKLRSQFNANRIALPILLHQLRLRNLSGAILIDMVGLPSKKRRLFQQDIEQALSKDPLHPKFLGFTNLGLGEILRPRKRPPLHELVSSDHGQAIKILYAVKQQFKNDLNHFKYRHITLITSIHLHQALKQDHWAASNFEQRCSISLKLESNPGFTNQQWELHYD